MEQIYLLAVTVNVYHGQVVISDYPGPTILHTLRKNIAENIREGHQTSSKIRVEGHVWGELKSSFAGSYAHHFTHVFAADCLWMAHEHANLLKSMAHFLSFDPIARVHVIAGFHTGRAKVASFFLDVLTASKLMVESIWECDTEGTRRAWDPVLPEEGAGERKKWLVIAILKREVVVSAE